MRSKIDQKDARILFQNADMLQKHEANLAEEANLSLQKDKELMTESAYIGIGSSIHNKRVKTQAAERAINYAEHFATIALTEALSECVEKALLLNTDEYAKLNPNYKDEIRTTVRSFLENADINENVNTPVMTSLFEAIKSETPPADLYLTEEEEQEIVSNHIMNNATIERNLEALKRDVCSRVANIVTKDQEALKNQEDDLSFADEKELTAAPMVPVQPEEVPGEEQFADPDAAPEAGMEQPAPAPEEAPVQQESLRIVKENTKRGIVETLAINEASKMLSEGLEYNKTLALANTIKYITILETLDASGIVTIGQQGYNRILSASGVNLNPVPRVNMPGAAITDQPVATVPEVKPVEEPKPVEIPEESKKEADIRSKISDIVRGSMPSEFSIGVEDKVFEPFEKWKQENSKFGKQLVDIPEKGLNENLHGKYTDRTGTKVYTEAQLREYFENQGFDLNYVDFDILAESWHFKLHK